MLKRSTLLLYCAVFALLLAYPAVTERAAGDATIRGRVVNDATNEPIAGADVRIQASLAEQAVTAADGTFTIRTTRPNGEPVFVAAGALDPTGKRAAYYNALLSVFVGVSDIELRLAPVSGDDPHYEFANPQDCRLCHNPIYQYWQDSPHRNAAKNTWVRDMYDGQGTPGTGSRGFTYKGVHPTLNGDCAECHSPMDSAKNPGDNTDFGQISDSAREWGVSCDVCHKTYDITNIKLPGVQGMVFARGARETLFGPLPDAAPNLPGVMRASYSAIHTNSLLCAACHEDNNDHNLDGNYLDPGSVPSEETYSEWLESRYSQPGPGAKTCMDCHMPPKGDTAFCEQYQPVTRDPSQVHSHDFEGTTDEYVQNAATVRAIARRDAGQLKVTVSITNDRTGHDLPGGQAVRHAILLVTATDTSGAQLTFVPEGSSTVPEYGGVGDPAEGYFAGLPGKGFARLFARGDQIGVFFTEALSVASDNRIPAGATDWSDYAFTLPEGFEPLKVEAKLIYRRAPRALVDEKGWATTGHGKPLADVTAPDFGVVMGRVDVDVTAPGPAVDSSKIINNSGLQLKVSPSGSPLFAAGATVEVTDEVGEWKAFISPSKIAPSGKKLTQKGKIGGLSLSKFWPNGAARFLRITNPDGGVTVLRLVRQNDRYVLA